MNTIKKVIMIIINPENLKLTATLDIMEIYSFFKKCSVLSFNDELLGIHIYD